MSITSKEVWRQKTDDIFFCFLWQMDIVMEYSSWRIPEFHSRASHSRMSSFSPLLFQRSKRQRKSKAESSTTKNEWHKTSMKQTNAPGSSYATTDHPTTTTHYWLRALWQFYSRPVVNHPIHWNFGIKTLLISPNPITMWYVGIFPLQ